jgi:catechol 2,3-dioxygenase-like lactoylglutathione lyase family enzyme
VIDSIHHVNIVTPRLDDMIHFYAAIVGLRQGPRPGFKSSGAWLYAGERPLVHLVEGRPDPRQPLPQLEHFAFGARGLAAFAARLDADGIPYRMTAVPDLGWPVVNLSDPDGNHVELVFEEEAPGESG